MTRTLSILMTALLGATLATAAGHAQTRPSAQAKCGPEVWSTDKMTYENVPCTGGEEIGAQTARAPGAQPTCGPETWSTDKMTYVGTPCPAGLTEENPGPKPSK